MGTSGLDTNAHRAEHIKAEKIQRRQQAKKYCSILKSRIDKIIALRSAAGSLQDSLQILSADAIDSLYILTVRAEATIKDIQAVILQEQSRRKAER